MRPTFVISIDTELVWGSFDHTSPAAFARRYPDLRGTIRALLAALEEFEIRATWALVGHLFLGSCECDADGRAHAGLPRPSFSWYPHDWYGQDPCTDRARDPLWYGDDVVDLILDARVPQEIGSHSFSHMPFGDEGCPAHVAEADLAECVRLAEARGITLRSFVFPRNIEGHHQALAASGFTTYRGRDPAWFDALPGMAKRGGHFLDELARLSPPVSSPVRDGEGLWNIPGSMMLTGRNGVRRLLPMAGRVSKAKAGLARAVDEGKVFHLWMHPSNLAVDRNAMISALRAVLAEAARLRDAGTLDVHSMGSLAASLATSPPGGETPRG